MQLHNKILIGVIAFFLISLSIGLYFLGHSDNVSKTQPEPRKLAPAQTEQPQPQGNLSVNDSILTQTVSGMIKIMWVGVTIGVVAASISVIMAMWRMR
jgi:hypothetical protein